MEDDALPGEVAFVQLLERTVTRVAEGEADLQTEELPLSLDGCYPYPKNISETATLDKPGFAAPEGLSYFDRDLRYTMYLLFRPEGEGSEWVPVKAIDWHWKGALRREERGWREFKQNEIFPSSSQGREVNEYPEWDRCDG
jgi:hypothetical protein